ncbi:MAG: nucleotidyltransferase domain-containing protein [Acutalibacteraceae bacterium]
MDMQVWMKEFQEAVRAAFGERVVCIGLQGSRGRGEASVTSDIDAAVIFDRLCPDDLRRYDRAVSALPHRALLCGFVAGRAELERWDDADLFQFWFDTTPVYGSLDFLRPRITEAAAQRAVRMGACNLYHACAHNMLHEKSPEVLGALLKSAVFTVQAKHCCAHGAYIRQHRALCRAVSGADREIVETALAAKAGTALDFEKTSDLLFTWAGELIRQPPCRGPIGTSAPRGE